MVLQGAFEEFVFMILMSGQGLLAVRLLADMEQSLSVANDPSPTANH